MQGRSSKTENELSADALKEMSLDHVGLFVVQLPGRQVGEPDKDHLHGWG